MKSDFTMVRTIEFQNNVIQYHDDIMKWKHFLHYWPISGYQWIPLKKG